MLNAPLYVKRTLSDGKKITVGTLAEIKTALTFNMILPICNSIRRRLLLSISKQI